MKSFICKTDTFEIDQYITGYCNWDKQNKSDLATERERQLTTARADQTTGLTKAWPMVTNGRAAKWAPEVVFSPFHALSRRQLTFLSCC